MNGGRPNSYPLNPYRSLLNPLTNPQYTICIICYTVNSVFLRDLPCGMPYNIILLDWTSDITEFYGKWTAG